VTLVGAGDISRCAHRSDNKTARLVGKIRGTVFTLGDNAYPHGTSAQFRQCYDPTWGIYKERTRPTAGNHEYYTSGAKPIFDHFGSSGAKPYFDYFGWRAGKPTRGYYSYERGTWHIVALNSNCKEVGGCEERSEQGSWLRRDLNHNPQRCTLAYFHHPLFSTANNITTPNVKPLWQILYNNHAEVIFNGHAHRYERYAPLTPGGKVDSQNGIRQFVAGTGARLVVVRSTPTRLLD
jgi:hypothetical protein